MEENYIEGLCGENTAQKQDIFYKFIEHHINIVSQIYNKAGGQTSDYFYFDVFSGPGYITNCKHYEGPGSPLIFHHLMSLSNIHYKMIVSEKNHIYRAMLSDILASENAPFELRNDALQCCRPHSGYGIAYIDPPMSKDSFLLLRNIMSDFSKQCERVDIVLYIAAGFMKRFFYAEHVPFKETLIDLIGLEEKKYKKHWVVREPYGKSQYAFLVGTNFLDWAEWSNARFFDVEKPEGWKILTRLNYKDKEPLIDIYKMKQQEMF